MASSDGAGLQYTFTNADINHITWGQHQAVACTASRRSLTILSIRSSSTAEQVPFAVLSKQHKLVHTGLGYGILTAAKADGTGSFTYTCLRRCGQRAAAATAGSSRTMRISSKRLSLAGVHANAQPTIAMLATTYSRNSDSAAAAWQLQLQSQVPACKGLQELPGDVTACCLLTKHAQVWPHQQQQQQHNGLGVNELQQLLEAANGSGASQPMHRVSSSSSGSSHVETLQLLAAAAAAAAEVACDGFNRLPAGSAAATAACCVSCSPVHPSAALFCALAQTLEPSCCSSGSDLDSKDAAPSTAALPQCMYLAGTSTGQVWLCKPEYALLGGSSSSRQAGRRLLLDLQQPVVALLPLPASLLGSSSSRTAFDHGSSSRTACDHGTAAAAAATAGGGVLVVGSYGRMALLEVPQQTASSAGATAAEQTELQQQQPAAQKDAKSAAEAARLLHVVQHQLPFVVVSAHVLTSHHCQQQMQPLLLLLSSCGNFYVAAVDGPEVMLNPTNNSHGTDTAAAAAAAAPHQPHLLQVKTVRLPIPKVSRVWALPVADDSSGFLSGKAAGAASNGQGDSAASSTIIMAQLTGSNELITIQALHITAYAQQHMSLRVGTSSSSSSHQFNLKLSNKAAAAARQQLTGLISALDVLADARRILEQAILSQDKYLTAVGEDLATLQDHTSLRRMPQPTAAAARHIGAFQQSSQLQCDVELQGIWPAPAAAAVGPASASLHMAATVNISGSSSGSSSGNAGPGSTCSSGLGQGWQLLVSCVAEAADTPSWQTTVQVASSSSMLSAALLLPLPVGCAVLQVGCWLRVYAAKMPAACNCTAQDSMANVPAIALLAEKHVSVVQLSRMLCMNPAADAVSNALSASGAQQSAAVVAAASPICSSSCSGSRSEAANSSYSCSLTLQAVAADESLCKTFSNSLMQQHVARPVPAKRMRQDAASDGAAAPKQQQQQGLTPVGTVLGSWLASVAHLPQHTVMQQNHSSGSGFGAFASAMLQNGSSTADCQNWQQQQQQVLALPGQSKLALLHGQVAVRLAGSCQGQLTWAAIPQLPQSSQRQQGLAAAAAAAGATAGLGCNSSSSSNVSANVDRSDSVCLPVQVVLQASSVPALAHLHRALMVAALQQLKNTFHAGSQAGSNSSSSTGSCSGQHGRWLISLQPAEQLRLVYQRLKRLQQQLLHLQDKADNFMEMRERVAEEMQPVAGNPCAERTARAAAGHSPGLTELLECWQQWNRGLHDMYGRMLLAVAGAAYLTCQEV